MKTDLPKPTAVLRARVVLPVAHSPIEDGAVSIAGNRIVSVTPWRETAEADRKLARDLGEVILLPGLVNAHCHLDYTHMAGQLPPQDSFTGWLTLLLGAKSGWLYTDYADSWLAGAAMLVNTGTTTVADIEMSPELLPEVWNATPLRVFSFLEMTGVKSRRPPAEILGDTLAKVASLPQGRCQAGLSPHAPYSTTPELLRLATTAARERNLRLTTHVAESAQEFDMFMHGRGEMFNWLIRNGRDMADCTLGSPVQHLERAGLLSERLLAVHVNCLAPGDAKLLGKNKTSVVHCPRSHDYFQHPKFPFAELTAERVNACLGTDSLASVYKPRKQTVELNMFDEMRAFATTFPDVAPKKILQLATVNGARALGLDGQVGELSTGAFADLIAVPHTGKSSEAFDAVLHHRGKVAASMIDGHWAIAP